MRTILIAALLSLTAGMLNVRAVPVDKQHGITTLRALYKRSPTGDTGPDRCVPIEPRLDPPLPNEQIKRMLPTFEALLDVQAAEERALKDRISIKTHSEHGNALWALQEQQACILRNQYSPTVLRQLQDALRDKVAEIQAQIADLRKAILRLRQGQQSVNRD
ncbi:hypothetical protein RI367_008341 [Sorochytrium milnesiophthora]